MKFQNRKIRKERNRGEEKKPAEYWQWLKSKDNLILNAGKLREKTKRNRLRKKKKNW